MSEFKYIDKKWFGEKTGNESPYLDLEIAYQLKRIADILEKLNHNYVALDKK